MYRARAEAVSGTRVYADGKWLQCIGNKRVSVGDRIWTDGRCVYGYERESQQPLIPTPQEDEGIPIIIGVEHSTGRHGLAPRTLHNIELYTFAKNKLKLVAKIISENNKRNFYSVVGDKSTLVGEMPNSDKWTNYTLMINDAKRTVFLYDEGTNFKKLFYGGKLSDHEENNFNTDTLLIATNMDKFGNRFDMIVHSTSDWQILEEGSSIIGKKILFKSLDIVKNGVVTKTITDEKYASIYACFIENENSCYIIFAEDNYAEYYTDFTLGTGDAYTWHITFSYYGSDGEYTLITEQIFQRYFLEWENIGSDISYPQISDIKFPLGNGFYCVIEGEIHNFPFTSHVLNLAGKSPAILEFHWEEYNTSCLQKKIFTPNDEQILSIHGGLFDMPLVTKINGGYLIGIKNYFWAPQECGGNGIVFPNSNWLGYHPTPPISAMEPGIFLLKNKKLTRLASGIYINQLFRPMKKIRRWQNRLQAIELEQHEI